MWLLDHQSSQRHVLSNNQSSSMIGGLDVKHPKVPKASGKLDFIHHHKNMGFNMSWLATCEFLHDLYKSQRLTNRNVEIRPHSLTGFAWQIDGAPGKSMCYGLDPWLDGPVTWPGEWIGPGKPLGGKLGQKNWTFWCHKRCKKVQDVVRRHKRFLKSNMLRLTTKNTSYRKCVGSLGKKDELWCNSDLATIKEMPEEQL